MSQKLTDKEKKLWRAVDETLHYVWDPIGVIGAPSARDEYYSYIPQVFKILISGNNEENIEEEITKYLIKIQTEDMGAEQSHESCKHTAEILYAWKKYIDETE